MSDGERIRVDKWLWHARFFKSRTLAGKVCQSGKVRVNGQPIAKAHVLVGAGDVLTFVKADAVKVVEIKALGTRRGPASEAQTLFEDQSPPAPKRERPIEPAPAAKREPGSGRPTKAERRALDKLKNQD